MDKVSSVSLITFGRKKQNLILAIENETIGSFLTTFNLYLQKGSIVILHCDGVIWGMAEVSSSYFYDEEKIWKDKVYPHRFKISGLKLFENPVNLNNGVYNRALKDEFGSGWAFKFLFAPKPLPKDVASALLADLNSVPKVNLQKFKESFEKIK